MGSMSDWQAIYGRSAGIHGPVRFCRSPTSMRSRSHERVERSNPDFGKPGFRCGDAGWLQTETLDDWFKRFGGPITPVAAVKAKSRALLRGKMNLDGDRKVAKLSTAIWRQRVDRTLFHRMLNCEDLNPEVHKRVLKMQAAQDEATRQAARR